jgi:hypothetical protein
MHYCHLHNSTAPLPLHHATAPLHALLLLHCITSLHHSTMPRHHSSHCSAAPPCSTPLHCLTNSSTPFHSITAPLRDLVATSLLCTTAPHHSSAPLPLCITSLHHSTTASPLHYITYYILHTGRLQHRPTRLPGKAPACLLAAMITTGMTGMAAVHECSA